MKIAIYGKEFEETYTQTITHLLQTLRQYGAQVIVQRAYYDYIKKHTRQLPKVESVFDSYFNLPEDTDFILSIGGDGTFLTTVSFVRERGIPIAGINIGRLGFLADISHHEIDQALQAIFQHQYEIEPRTLLQVDTLKQAFSPFNYALNELAVTKKNSASMVTIHTYINDVYLNSYWADGLIVSTPTGSTAYSLSVGGPILLPNSTDFIITPLASHTLTARPIVIPDAHTIKLKLEGRTHNFLATIDSQSRVLSMDETLEIRKAPFTINVLKLKGYSYFSTLRNKLMWGADKRN